MFITQMIMRDVNNGWIIRYVHANVASFFFIFVYALNHKFIIINTLNFSNFKGCYLLASQRTENQILFVIFTCLQLQITILCVIVKIYNQIINLYKFTFCYYYCYAVSLSLLVTLATSYAKVLIYNTRLWMITRISILERFLKTFTTLDNSSLLSLKYKDIKNKNNEKELDTNFLQWFVGFTDAEGCFLIQSRNNSEIHFCFQITLHIEDSAVLFLIREKLGIGIVNIRGNTCSFTVNSFQLILDILLPIFDKYSLITHKQLDYRD